MPARVRNTESVHIRLTKSLLLRIRAFATATHRPFAFACEKLMTDAVDAWEREQKSERVPK